MAASSSSSIPKSFKYDVFLSFRGTDTRKNFVDHLYQALHEKGIYTYKDEERITKGKRISDKLLGSIEESQFYIVVFSKNYASSSWCLDELVKIMECHNTKKHTAYPLFYGVEPTEVRKQTGAFGEAFSVHENNEAAGKWRNALKEAADLAGWELKNTSNGSEARFIKNIIEEISVELYTINFSFDKNLVGIEARVSDIVSSLEIGVDDVRMIGIKGMGGAGKTTLARAIFDKISIQFEGISFVENVREVTSNPLSGLKSLQKQILSDVLNEEVRVSGVRDGQNLLKRRMRGRKILIALDDVDDIEQLEALSGESEWFKEGSRIIITTRDEQLLLAHGVSLICDVNLLSNEEAICLFSKYAFRRDSPVQGYEELSEQVVNYAAGLPLTIKVLGSQLFGKDKLEWEDALQRLETIPLARTLKILELSYIVLEDDQKEIFLDVACIMKGWERDRAIKSLESCGFRAKFGLRVLQQKSLITVDDKDCVGMHDHIEEMAMDIVRRSHPDMPHKHSRLWRDDEIEHIFANDLGTEETRCIEFNYAENFNPYTFIKGLGKMKALRYLYVHMDSRDRGLELDISSPNFQDALRCLSFWQDYRVSCFPKTLILSFPNALRYLHFECYPFTSLPKTFEANNLVTLEMHGSKVIQLWEGGEHKNLDRLRFLDLSWSKSLRTLDLRMAPNLEMLNIAGCRGLVELPDGMWTLKHLRSLELNRCLFLEKLPEDLFRLGCLEKLNLSFTKIKHLPDSICMLRHLKYLYLAYLLIEKLPEDLGHLECLNELDSRGASFEHLPDSICKLKHLHYLNLRRCLLLEKLPEDIGKLECLRHLDLSYTKIKHLPDSICKLKHLNYLGLKKCLLLEKLPEDLGHLECLEKIKLSHTKIKHLPDSICKLKHLKSLSLGKCLLLEKLPEDLGELECLMDLDLSFKRETLLDDLLSTKIKDLPDSICVLKTLKSLSLSGCMLLEKLPQDLSGLKGLRKLNLSSTKIKHLPDSICMLKCLKFLDLTECSLLEKLPEDVGRLECLKELYVEGTNISHLPQSILLLKGLKIYGTREDLQSFGFTSQIKKLGDEDRWWLCYVKLLCYKDKDEDVEA